MRTHPYPGSVKVILFGSCGAVNESSGLALVAIKGFCSNALARGASPEALYTVDPPPGRRGLIAESPRPLITLPSGAP